MMIWGFDDEMGQWTAASKLHDEGTPFVWRINVNENGEFLVLDSDGELLNCEPFPLTCLHNAKEWCQAEEDDLTSPANPSQAK